MRKLHSKKTMIAYIFVVLIVLAGIGLPYMLLKLQETRLIAQTDKYSLDVTAEAASAIETSADGKEGENQSETDQSAQEITVLDADDLYTRLYAWDNGSNLTTRDPNNDELSIESAVRIAREEVQALVANDAIPSIGISNYILDYAALTSKDCPDLPTGTTPLSSNVIGRWEITFIEKTDASELTLILDAASGMIIGYSFSTDKMYELHFHEMLVGFAQYHGLFRSDLSFSSKYNYNVLDIGGFRISYSDTSSADHIEYEISILSQS